MGVRANYPAPLFNFNPTTPPEKKNPLESLKQYVVVQLDKVTAKTVKGITIGQHGLKTERDFDYYRRGYNNFFGQQQLKKETFLNHLLRGTYVAVDVEGLEAVKQHYRDLQAADVAAA